MKHCRGLQALKKLRLKPYTDHASNDFCLKLDRLITCFPRSRQSCKPHVCVCLLVHMYAYVYAYCTYVYTHTQRSKIHHHRCRKGQAVPASGALRGRFRASGPKPCTLAPSQSAPPSGTWMEFQAMGLSRQNSRAGT